jgi:hypothetical protein
MGKSDIEMAAYAMLFTHRAHAVRRCFPACNPARRFLPIYVCGALAHDFCGVLQGAEYSAFLVRDVWRTCDDTGGTRTGTWLPGEKKQNGI